MIGNNHAVGRSPILELENCVNDACALLELLGKELAERRENQDDALGGSVGCGYLQLAHDSALKLHNTYNQAHAQWRELWLATKN